MKITCPSCSAKYTVADEKVRGRTVKIKCKKCGATISAGPEDGAAGASAGASAETNLPTSGGEWLINIGEGDQRSLSVEQISELYQQRTITEETYVWREGMAEWLPLASVPEMASILTSSAPNEPDEMDDGMPTMMAPVQDFNFAASLPRPAAGVPAPAPIAAPAPVAVPAPAPAARRGAPRSKDLFASSTEDVATGFASPAPSNPPPPRRPEPPAPGMMNSDEASGILDIRKLQGVIGSKPEAPKKEEKIDDIMNLGGGALFSSPIAPPDFSNALAPPDFSAPPPPEPPKPVAAAPIAPMPAIVDPTSFAAPPKSKTPLMILGAAVFLVLGIGGTMMVMGPKKGAEEENKTATVASADPEKKAADDTKTEEKKAEPAPSAQPEEKKGDSEAEVEPDLPPGKVLTPEEKKRRDEAFKKKKEESEKKKKEEEEKKKKAKEEEEKKKKAETETAAAAAAPGGDKPFDRAAANSALSSIASSATSCKKADGPTGSGKVAVTFAPSGRVTTANIEGSFAGTSVGSCIAVRFRSAKIPPFAGSPVTVRKTFTIHLSVAYRDPSLTFCARLWHSDRL